MKLKMDRKMTFLGLFFLGLFSMQLTAQEITDELNNFKEVKTFNGIEVIVIPASENRIEITGHSKEKVKYQVVEERLEIRLTLDNIWSNDNTLITVYGNSIEVIDANEGSIVKTEGTLKSNFSELRAQEGAAIYAEVKSEKVKAKAITGGIINVRGKTENLEVEANTAGQFNGKNLKSKEAFITSSSAAKTEIYASDYCKATAKLGGQIEILGNPKKVDYKTTLGGKIL